MLYCCPQRPSFCGRFLCGPQNFSGGDTDSEDVKQSWTGKWQTAHMVDPAGLGLACFRVREEADLHHSRNHLERSHDGNRHYHYLS